MAQPSGASPQVGNSGRLYRGGPPERTEVTQGDEEKKKKLEAVAKILNSGRDWKNEPSFPSQRTALPQTTRNDVRQFDVFDLTTDEGKKQLNALMRDAKSPCADSPRVDLIRSESYWSPTKCKIFVEVQFERVLYMQLDAESMKILSASANSPE